MWLLQVLGSSGPGWVLWVEEPGSDTGGAAESAVMSDE